MNNFSRGPQGQYNPYAAGQTVAASNTLIQRVSYLLCTALFVTAGAAWWADASKLSPVLFLPLMLATFACVFGISFARNNPSLSLTLLYVLSVLEGLLMGPLLGTIARGFPYGAAVIGEAALLSAVIVGGLGTYVWISGKDFGGIGKMLFWALIGLLVVGLLRLFVSFSPGLNLVYAIGGAVIFAGFTLYDFSNIKFRYGPNDYVQATVGLYLDFLNLFWFLVQILLSLSGGGSSRRS
jgi:FtsH-binding integral membrane protein